MRSLFVPLRPLTALSAVQGQVRVCGQLPGQVQVHVHVQGRHHGPVQYLAQVHASAAVRAFERGPDVRPSSCPAGTLSRVLGGFAVFFT